MGRTPSTRNVEKINRIKYTNPHCLGDTFLPILLPFFILRENRQYRLVLKVPKTKMTKITEYDIEFFAIGLFETLGYKYVYAPDIAPDGKAPERESYEQVLLLDRLQKAVKRINISIPANAQAEAIKEIQRIASPDLLTNNETFHRLLTEGIPVSKRVDGTERGDRVWLIDFENPYNNDFLVANQFTVVENNQNKRPDIVLFVNGIPLVVIELKNAVDENATIRSAFKQIETYKSIIPSLWIFR